MPEHEPYTDPILGTATWDNDRGGWIFTLVLPSGRSVEGSVRPEDSRVHLSSHELNESRSCVRLVRANEAAIREHVADKMYAHMLEWHDPEQGQALTRDAFRDRIALLVCRYSRTTGPR